MVVFVNDGAADMNDRNSDISEKFKKQKERMWVNVLVPTAFFKEYGVQKRFKINHIKEVVIGTVNFNKNVSLVIENL
jgi:hypothetical protein